MNNTTTSTAAGEWLSALADGELRADEVTAVLLACEQAGWPALENWSSYHLIGDALRSPALADSAGSDMQFLNRFNERLAQEVRLGVLPLPHNEAGVQPLAASVTPTTGPVAEERGAASNDDTFRWKLAAGFASLAAVASMAWNSSGFVSPAAAPQLAQGPVAEQIVVASPQGPVVRDARLEELLAAHRQLGGATALQAPSGFLRNAAFEAVPGTRR